MQVEIRPINEISAEIEITVDQERVETAYQKYLGKAVKDIEIPGFRKGKAPIQMMERLHGERIKDYFEKDFIDEVFDEAAKEHEIHYLLFPEVKEIKWERGTEMQIKLQIEHEPELQFHQVEGLQIPFRPELLDDQVTKFLENLAREHTIAQDVDVAEDKDQLEVELSFEHNGNPYRKNVTMYAGEELPQRSLPELTGAQTGNSIEKELTGTAIKLLTMDKELDLGNDSLYPCKLQVNSIVRYKVPEMDDEFAKDMDYDNMEEMRTKVADDLRLKLEHKNMEAQNGAIIGKLYKDNPFSPPPKTLRYIVEQQLERMDPKYREVLQQYYFQQTMQEMVSVYIIKALRKQRPLELSDELLEDYTEHCAILEDKTVSAFKETNKEFVSSEDFKDSALNYHLLRQIAASSEFVEPVNEPEEPVSSNDETDTEENEA